MESSRDAQIRQMCDFILQEAKEKSNEIHLKTKHDSNLEKQMTVHNAKNKIQKEFKAKEKELHTQKRIETSRKQAKFRVVKMEEREQLLDQVKADAVQALQTVTSDKTKYQAMLRDLIVQGLIKLNEPKVEVVVRACDLELAKKAKSGAIKKYIDLIKEATGETPNCSLEFNVGGRELPPADDGSGRKSCAGGVKLLASNGRIVCDNTLDSRLSVAFDELMPEIRSSLFSKRV